MSCGKKRSWEREVHKSWSKQFGAWLLTQYFGLRGRQEHHSMKVEDFSFGLDENNMEHVEFIENPTKTRQSGLSAKPRSFLPKMFATEMEDVPLQSSKSFYGVVLPNYEQPVHFISLACQIRPRKFGTSGSRWERTRSMA